MLCIVYWGEGSIDIWLASPKCADRPTFLIASVDPFPLAIPTYEAASLREAKVCQLEFLSESPLVTGAWGLHAFRGLVPAQGPSHILLS